MLHMTISTPAECNFNVFYSSENVTRMTWLADTVIGKKMTGWKGKKQPLALQLTIFATNVLSCKVFIIQVSILHDLCCNYWRISLTWQPLLLPKMRIKRYPSQVALLVMPKDNAPLRRASVFQKKPLWSCGQHD